VEIGTIDAAPRATLDRIKADSSVRYDSEFLVYAQESGEQRATLLATRFNLRTLSNTGNPTVLVENVYLGINDAAFTTSSTGTLVYRESQVKDSVTRLTWFNPQGVRVTSVNPPPPGKIRDYRGFPDGKQVLIGMRPGLDSNFNLYIYDVDSRNSRRLTFDTGDDRHPIISPDGRLAMWQRVKQSGSALYIKATNGVGPERSIGKFPASLANLTQWSAHHVIAVVDDDKTGKDIWVFDPDDLGTAKPYAHTEADENMGSLSPDETLMAFGYMRESGRPEIHIRRFPDDGSMWSVSGSEGGRFPKWGAGGKKLYFKGDHNEMMEVEVLVKNGVVKPGTPKRLFQSNTDFRQQFDLTRNGFFMPDPEKDEAGLVSQVNPLIWITNWKMALKNP
jgi:hypothetical protein